MAELDKKKVELAQRILASDDAALIDHLTDLLDAQGDAWWATLPPRIKASVKRSEEQLAQGEVRSSTAVRKHIRRWAGV